MKNRAITIAAIFTSFFLSGCCHCGSYEGGQKQNFPVASAVTKLSAQLEAVVRYEKPDATATEAELLRRATKSDPGLLDEFSGYALRVHVLDRHAIVLVCTEDGKQGLLEDLGCTGPLDRNLWQESAVAPCAVTLSVEACGIDR